MPTTTATTGSPPLADHDGLAVQQHVSPPRPPLEACVRERIAQLHSQGVPTFTLTDFGEAAERAGRPLSWVGDHLLVLEGVGVLRPAGRSCERAWSLTPGTEYLR